jgi:hypothetical protein
VFERIILGRTRMLLQVAWFVASVEIHPELAQGAARPLHGLDLRLGALLHFRLLLRCARQTLGLPAGRHGTLCVHRIGGLEALRERQTLVFAANETSAGALSRSMRAVSRGNSISNVSKSLALFSLSTSITIGPALGVRSPIGRYSRSTPSLLMLSTKSMNACVPTTDNATQTPIAVQKQISIRMQQISDHFYSFGDHRKERIRSSTLSVTISYVFDD